MEDTPVLALKIIKKGGGGARVYLGLRFMVMLLIAILSILPYRRHVPYL